jgi:hypothetical protein
VTDAETSSYQRSAELWTALEQVRPIVMSVQVGADSTPREARHFMQDWATVAGGYYQYTRSHGEMDRAFDRLATWLRRPAAYTLSFSATTEVPPTPSPTPTLVPSPTPEPTATATPSSTPSPTVETTATIPPTVTMTPTPTSTVPAFGTIRVADSRTGTDGDAPAISTQIAVEIILDTSGSMLQELEPGQLRIDIAKAVLTDLVEQQLPPGIPVALRIFGNRPDSCETVLALPLQPLDPASVSAQIAGLQVINLVRTPLGFALEQVAGDLAGFDGPKVVILVTDGEETCDGDPAGAIQRLVEQGVDVQVNIVGFALDDDALKATFRGWARIGNGTYFDATNAEELNRAIAGAAGAPFRIYDANGNLVGSGTVGGDAVEVPAGVYTIVILTEPEVRIDQVAVGPEAQLTIDLADR